MPSSEYARRLRQLIDYGDESICQRLFIDLNSERRRDRIKFDNTRFKEDTDLFGDAISESDEEKTSQKGLS
ncbi:unnamed protein product [Rotaria sordida]|uniref:Uncharacterized protein n=2 Tax=Rotaria sordida TaxID=392033 RepID=A0A815H0B6_9BILA|nr:unnamed protein product [Rotaria sordida]